MHFKDLHLVECKQQQQDSDDNMVGIFSLIAFAESSKNSLGKHDQHLRAFKKNKKNQFKGEARASRSKSCQYSHPLFKL